MNARVYVAGGKVSCWHPRWDDKGRLSDESSALLVNEARAILADRADKGFGREPTELRFMQLAMRGVWVLEDQKAGKCALGCVPGRGLPPPMSPSGRRGTIEL